MKIAYVANVRMPSERAHAVQIAHMCAVFAQAGVLTKLVVPTRPAEAADPATYYGLTTSFPVVRTYAPDTVSWGKGGFLFESVLFALTASRVILKDEYVFGRDELVLLMLSCLRRVPIIWESHTGAWNLAARLIARRAHLIVVVSDGLRNLYIARGVKADRILVAHDGIDLDHFDRVPTAEEARIRLGLPPGPIALYVGGFGGWKGTDTLGAAASHIEGVTFVAVGGREEQLDSLKETYPRVRFLGPRPYRELPVILAAADVLILPNTARDPISARYTSPLKLFAYMASGKPIVASDLPSIREVLDTESGYLVAPDDPQALADGIRAVLENPDAGQARARRARTLVAHYTWWNRANAILSRI